MKLNKVVLQCPCAFNNVAYPTGTEFYLQDNRTRGPGPFELKLKLFKITGEDLGSVNLRDCLYLKNIEPEMKRVDVGYRRISSKHQLVSRIDRTDWKEYMASKSRVWSMEDGLDWVQDLGNTAADHYRRCYSKDIVRIKDVNDYKTYKASDACSDDYLRIPEKMRTV